MIEKIPEHLLLRAKAMRERAAAEGTKKVEDVKASARQILEKYGSDAEVTTTPVARGEEGFRSFKMLRRNDESGVSGKGVVLEGVVFTCGTTVIHWLTPAPKGSISIWDSFDMFKQIHIDSHPNNDTMLFWGDGTTWSQNGKDTTST